MKNIFKLLVLVQLTINSACFSQDTSFLPLKMEIDIDTVYQFPYKGLWFYGLFDFNGLFTYEKVYKIRARLKNTGKRTLYFYMMTCSKEDHLKTDNNLVDFFNWGCDSNFPVLYNLKEGESDSFTVDVIKYLSYGNTIKLPLRHPFPKTRLGLILVNDIYKDVFLRNPFEKVKNEKDWYGIIWSNALSL